MTAQARKQKPSIGWLEQSYYDQHLSSTTAAGSYNLAAEIDRMPFIGPLKVRLFGV